MHISQFPKEPIDLSDIKPPSQWKRPTPKIWITAEQNQKRSGGTRKESIDEMR